MTNYILVPTKTKTNIAFVDGILVFVDDNTVSPVGYPEMYQYQELYLKDIPATNLQEKEIKEFISFFNKKKKTRTYSAFYRLTWEKNKDNKWEFYWILDPIKRLVPIEDIPVINYGNSIEYKLPAINIENELEIIEFYKRFMISEVIRKNNTSINSLLKENEEYLNIQF